MTTMPYEGYDLVFARVRKLKGSGGGAARESGTAGCREIKACCVRPGGGRMVVGSNVLIRLTGP
jgi:hypothetical protein